MAKAGMATPTTKWEGEDTAIRIYAQIVDTLDIDAVIRAVNGMKDG